MKLKLVNLINAIDILGKLNTQRFDDGVTGYKLAHNIGIINSALELYNKEKEKFIEDCKVKRKPDKSLAVPPETRDEFTRKLNNLLGQEIELAILTISPCQLSGYTPMEIQSIEWMIEVEKE